MRRQPVLVFMVVAGCGANSPSSHAPGSPGPIEAAHPAAPTHGAPAIGPWGFDLAGMDRSVAPGDDFDRYASGGWLARTRIPDDQEMYSTMLMLTERGQEWTREVIESAGGAPGTDGQRVADYYRSFMDEASIEAAGAAPLQARLDQIAAIRDLHGLVAQLAAAARRDATVPFKIFINQDARVPDRYLAHISQGGIGLSDRDMYDAARTQFTAVRTAYRAYIATTFALIGVARGEARAAAVYALEDKIAAALWPRAQSYDREKTYNKLTVEELARLAPDVPWRSYLEAVGLAGAHAVNVDEPSAIAAISRLVAHEPLAAWKDYLTFHAVDDAAPNLSRKFVEAQFAYWKTISGVSEMPARWKRVVEHMTWHMGDAVGRLYVAKHFDPDARRRAQVLVQNLLAAMDRRLDRLAWMSAETRARAKAKLAAYHTKIGYPDRWIDYTALTIKPGDPVGNAERLAAFDLDRRLARLDQPVDRSDWLMAPMMVDAYHSNARNEIVFPAGILQPPFFDPNADDAVNYGAIGTMIGHEISHGFDDQGAKFNGSGALDNWWTADDAARFKASTDKLVAQYSAYCPLPAADGKPAGCVNGTLTLGENISDLAGLAIAYDAYELSLGGKPAPVLDGFTGEQRFFLGFAQIWRTKYRPEALARQLVSYDHSPGPLRTATVRNLDAWYDAFHPRPTDALYLAPDQRIRIW